MMKVVAFLLLNLLKFGDGFTFKAPSLLNSSSLKKTALNSSPQSPDELISNPSVWNPIKESLNAVPCFACTNAQGQPLQYTIGGQLLAFFYLDIEAAFKEKLTAENEGIPGLSLTPFPLGEVFEMGIQQKAIVIPSQKAVEQAGAPKGMDPIGQQVPVFGCMDLVENLEDGSTMVPMFLNKMEAENAMQMALENSAQKGEFQITVMPLAGAVQTQVKEFGRRAFTYVPDNSSLDYLRSVQQQQQDMPFQ